MPYRAQLGGIASSGQYGSPSHQLPIADIIKAIQEGSISLLQGAALRKMAERRMALEEQNSRQTFELHKATLDATNAWRQSLQGERAQTRAAKPAAETAKNRQARNTLLKMFPEHSLVRPDENGVVPEFDDTEDYQKPLGDAMRQGDTHAKQQQALTDRISMFEKADKARQGMATMKETWKREDTTAKNTVETPAQYRLRRNEMLSRLAAQFDGDPDGMKQFLGSDPGAKADAEHYKIQDYEIQGAAGVVTKKNTTQDTNAARSIFSSGMAADPAAAARMVPALKPVPRRKPEAGPGSQMFGADQAARALTGIDTPGGNGAGTIDLNAPPRAQPAAATTPAPIAPIASPAAQQPPAKVQPLATPKPAAGGAAPPTGAPRGMVETQAKYDAMLQGGRGFSGYQHPPMTDAEIAGRYDIHPSVKRVKAPTPPSTPVTPPAGVERSAVLTKVFEPTKPPAKPPTPDEEEF